MAYLSQYCLHRVHKSYNPPIKSLRMPDERHRWSRLTASVSYEMK